MQSGALVATLPGHRACLFPDGRILTWSAHWSNFDHNLYVWDLWDRQNTSQLATLNGHRSDIRGAQILDDGRILSWSRDRTLRLWNGDNGEQLSILNGHHGDIKGAFSLPDGRILSWSHDCTLRLWNGESGDLLFILEGHTKLVTGAMELSDRNLLSWSEDGTLRLWDGQSGAPLAILEGHSYHIVGALELPDERILSWAEDGTLRLWDGQSGASLAILKGHAYRIKGALELPDGRILSWSEVESLLWDGQRGQLVSGPLWQLDLPWLAPQFLHHRLALEAPQAISGQSAAWADGKTAGITSCTRAAPACWHGPSAVESHVLSPEGILVVSLNSGHVFCLQLFRGAQRITLEDYETGRSPLVDGPVQR